MSEYTWTMQVCRTAEEMAATRDAVGAMLEGLGNNIIKHLGNVELGRSVRMFIRNQAGQVVGGIIGNMFGGWVYVELLWVEESLRNQGLGSQLLRALEEEAIRMGCQHAHLDTYSFEARPFYEQHGYEVFAVLEDYPAGHRKFFLKKALLP